MSAVGFVLPAASIGLGALLVKPRRGFFPTNDVGANAKPLIAQAIISETHTDRLEITEHPVEQGAPIADHAYKRPAEVIIVCGWSNSPSAGASLLNAAIGAVGAIAPAVGVLAAIPSTVGAAQALMSGNTETQVRAMYKRLLYLQESRIPFDLYTGKRLYGDMLVESLTTTTERPTENSLIVTIVCRQVIIVETRVATLSTNPDVYKIPNIIKFSLSAISPGRRSISIIAIRCLA